jgi:hypothetical protein
MFRTHNPIGTFSRDEWKTVKLGDKDKFFKIHHFLFMYKGKSFNIEVQESLTGDFMAHADNNSDPHDAVKSCHGKTLEECLHAIVSEIQKK